VSKKTVILVLGTACTTYSELTQALRDTWFNIKNKNIAIIHYVGGLTQTKTPYFKDNNLFIPCDDSLYNIGTKTIMAFDWLLQNTDFDYIFRCNLGSFIDPNKLINFLDDKPNKNFYCGIIGNYHDQINFASGSGYFLSKDLVNLTVKHKNIWNHSLMDDVALGDFLSKCNVPINSSAKRLSYCDNETYYQIGDKIVDFIPESELYHIRCRSTDRRLDIKTIKDLYNKQQEL
jgi:hypothetical protein